MDLRWRIQALELAEHRQVQRSNLHDGTQPLIREKVIKGNGHPLFPGQMHQLCEHNCGQTQVGEARFHEAKSRVRSSSQTGWINQKPEKRLGVRYETLPVELGHAGARRAAGLAFCSTRTVDSARRARISSWMSIASNAGAR